MVRGGACRGQGECQLWRDCAGAHAEPSGLASSQQEARCLWARQGTAAPSPAFPTTPGTQISTVRNRLTALTPHTPCLYKNPSTSRHSQASSQFDKAETL